MIKEEKKMINEIDSKGCGICLGSEVIKGIRIYNFCGKNDCYCRECSNMKMKEKGK